eukprot:GFYU01000617.1.p1 GENE.GFYU01000617.1~~GFYU01000617.1.p1  ORF type:complete len:476 (-),score=169.81 GFYU01000617.1:179-1564(-)
MLKSPSFWNAEKEAPLLNLDEGYLKQAGDSLFERAKGWFETAEAELPPNDDPPADPVKEEEWSRIVIKDAERTFASQENRDKMIKLLNRVRRRFGDYAQSLGYVASLLMLVMEPEEVEGLLIQLNSHDEYMPGYWKHQAAACVADGYVLNQYIGDKFPEVHTHFARNGILPETYVTKWFAGLCIHVLNFSSLFDFIENYIENGVPYLFQFGLSVIKHLEGHILATNDQAKMLGLLRLDRAYGITSEDCAEIVAGAENFEVDFEDVVEKRVVERERVDRRIEQASRVNIDSDDDDSEEEGVGCDACEDNMPEFKCNDCSMLLCEECHTLDTGKHKSGHGVEPWDGEIEDDEETEDEEDEPPAPVKPATPVKVASPKASPKAAKPASPVAPPKVASPARKVASPVAPAKVASPTRSRPSPAKINTAAGANDSILAPFDPAIPANTVMIVLGYYTYLAICGLFC